VFYADRDATHFPDTYCQRLDRLEMSAKAAYYVVKSLRMLRGQISSLSPQDLSQG